MYAGYANSQAAMQDMAFECAVHPEYLQLKASLGNVTAIDTALLDNNPYRIACQPRAGDSTSLIEARHRAYELRVHSIVSWFALSAATSC